MTIVYDMSVLLLTLFSIILIAMIAVTAARHEPAWCAFFCTVQAAAVAAVIYAIRTERRAKCNLK